jgi:hypothetical protein
MRRILLALVPLLVVGTLIEVVLRTTHLFNARLSWTEPDRDIGWKFAPGREYWFFAENDHPITGRINALGWRDRERSVKKPPRTYRIAVLGDSYVEAFQVELERTFMALAEDAYRSVRVPGYDTVEVMSFGRSGMSPAEESIVLRRDVLPCDPDVVVLLFTPNNDIADVNPATAVDLYRPFFHRTHNDSLVLDASFRQRRGFRLREAITPLKQHSALVSLVIERYNTLRQARAHARVHRVDEAGLTRAHRICTAEPDSVFAGNYALCKLLIAAMARECERWDAQLCLAAVPLVYREDAVAEMRAADPSFDPDFFDRDLGAFAAGHQISFFPMTRGFAERAKGGVSLHWGHWNYAGHEAAFELLLAPGRGVAPVVGDRQTIYK